METVFDRVRKGLMPLSTALVDVFLASGDMLEAMFATRKHGAESVPEADIAALCERLRAFLQPATPSGDAAGTAPIAAAPLPSAAGPVATVELEVTFGPFDKTFKAAAVDDLIAELRRCGTVDEIVRPAPAGGKRVGKRVERRFRVVTDVSVQDLASTIGFVTDTAHFRIDVIDEVPSPMACPIEDEPVVAVAEQARPVIDEKDFCLFVEPAAQALNNEEPATAPHVATVHALVIPAAAKAPATPVAPKAVAAADASSIRVSVQKVDALINLVGELVITEAMLAQVSTQIDSVLFESLSNGLEQLRRNTRDLQESAMSIRMMPMSFVFGRFPRIVRDLAGVLNKQIELKTEGESTELDKGLIERIIDPLTHLVRNSLDHGVELPAARLAAGKPAHGTVTLRAFHRGGNIIVEVLDDGAGLDREKLLRKARERGMSVSETMSDQEVFALIFDAGFSTAEKVTDVSGRGVGMDVVRRNIREMGGNVDISSTLGVGTRISIRLPLTLAILDGMSVAVGKEVFIIPLTYIVESLQPAEADVKTIAGQGRVVRVRGEYLRLLPLHEVLNIQAATTEPHRGIVVILEAEGRKAAMFVDALVGQHQVVIKSLESNYRRVQGVSGATIMGDGRVALILDVAELVGVAKDYAKAA
jgi:two-component system chemotaxis sensor kinase CheA